MQGITGGAANPAGQAANAGTPPAAGTAAPANNAAGAEIVPNPSAGGASTTPGATVPSPLAPGTTPPANDANSAATDFGNDVAPASGSSAAAPASGGTSTPPAVRRQTEPRAIHHQDLVQRRAAVRRPRDRVLRRRLLLLLRRILTPRALPRKRRSTFGRSRLVSRIASRRRKRRLFLAGFSARAYELVRDTAPPWDRQLTMSALRPWLELSADGQTGPCESAADFRWPTHGRW